VPLGAGSDTPLGGTVSGVRIAGRHPGAQVDPLPTVCYLNRVSIDITELETHRPAITGHCYRMLGSAADAEDAAQDTFVRAWQSLHRFEGRSSLKTWLYRIATNVCLDALSDKARRFRPMEEGPAGTVQDDLVDRPRTHWLEPVPDAYVVKVNVFRRSAKRPEAKPNGFEGGGIGVEGTRGEGDVSPLPPVPSLGRPEETLPAARTPHRPTRPRTPGARRPRCDGVKGAPGWCGRQSSRPRMLLCRLAQSRSDRQVDGTDLAEPASSVECNPGRMPGGLLNSRPLAG